MNTLDLKNKLNEQHAKANAYYEKGLYAEAIREFQNARQFVQSPEDAEILQSNIQTIQEMIQEQDMQPVPFDENDEMDQPPEHNRKLLLVTILVGLVCITPIALKCLEIFGQNQVRPAQEITKSAPVVAAGAVTNSDSQTTGQPENTKPAKPVLATVQTMYIKGSGVNLRAEASTSASTVSSLSKGESVQIVKDQARQADGYTWSQIQTANQKTGWVASLFLMQEPVANAPLITADVKKINGDQVSLRTEPSVKGALVRRLALNTEVTYISEKAVTADGYLWSQIKTPAGKGWVADKFVN